MLEIEFHNREKEIHEVMRILNSRPDLITFVYGPINSGKTELFQHLIKTLPKKYKVFYINLRGIYVSKADDFLKVLFEVDEREYDLKDYLRVLIDYLPDKVDLPFIGGIPVPKNLFKKFFEEKEIENVFKYIERLFTTLSQKFTPILILDELQVIGDIKINGLLIYELFNLFVRLTKELHSCHVFAITSDSLFIERVFNEAMLHGRCRYLLVDDFDYDTTKEFLEKHGFSQDEIDLTWNYFGGKPVYLVEAIKNKDRLKDFCEKLVRLRRRQIKDSLYSLNVDFRKSVLKLLSNFKDRDSLTYDYLTEELRWCIKNIILFLDPLNDIVKPQSQLDLLAIRRILKEITS